ncbi:importin-alpha export receptor [Lithohypha guttulata]|uniref:Importin-alpha export receptor n=1 Tax=Lithohypha guttulata TaxID=1690604 RepID=A0AAN7YEH8_9EURO|nr:importin-alpha export receptor [Lithohypha guttulata]
MAELTTLAQLLNATLDPKQNKQAEAQIKSQEAQPGFALLLLQITASDSHPLQTRLASALFFKNFVKRNWTDVEGNYKLQEQDVVAIKKEIIGLMISVPSNIQSQLGEAVSIIADSDFYERWDTLVDDLVSRLTADNIKVNTGVLQVAHSIFGRWRPLFRSDELYAEVNHVIQKFGSPFLTLWQTLDSYIDSHASDTTALKAAFVELDLILQLFYDLSCQDLPPVVEDNLAGIAGLLLKYLTYDNKALQTEDEDEAGPLQTTKANIFEALTLYVGKYYEDFAKHMQGFIQSSWTLLTTVGPEPKNDILVSKALQFLTSVTKINEQAQNFNDPNVQSQIVEKVVVPNVALRDSDVETFEDEPIEFIRRDLEGSDSETRRRAASDFLKELSDQFEESVTSIGMSIIEKLLQDHKSNPASNWRSKDTAVNLYYAIAAKGTATVSHGIVSVNQRVNIGDFFSQNLAADLQDANAQPLLKVDAIKYLYVFRSLMGKDQWQQVIPLLVNHLGHSNYCVYTYAAVVTERALALIDQTTNKPIIDPANIVPLAKDLTEHLFSLILRDRQPAKVQENEFVMRCIMRVLIVLREEISRVAGSVLHHLIDITNIIATNPSNPRFYYYHFESIGAVIRFSAASTAESLCTALYGPFTNILQNGVDEFMPYVFQLLAALFEKEPIKPLPQNFSPLVAPVLSPVLWEQRGNVPALVRLLSAIIPRAADDLVKNNQLPNVLGLFQKLVSTKTNEGYGCDLLEDCVTSFSPEALKPYWTDILNIMLTRLQGKQAASFQSRFVRFYHFFASQDNRGLGADVFVVETDKIQNDVFRGLYLSIILPKTQELARPIDRKIAAVALTKTLADSQAFATRYPKGWPLTCNALLKLLENPPVPPKSDDMIVDQDVEDTVFGVGFTALNTVRKVPQDPFENITDLRKWVGQHLKEADQRNGGRIGQAVGGMDSAAQQALQSYMSS